MFSHDDSHLSLLPCTFLGELCERGKGELLASFSLRSRYLHKLSLLCCIRILVFKELDVFLFFFGYFREEAVFCLFLEDKNACFLAREDVFALTKGGQGEHLLEKRYEVVYQLLVLQHSGQTHCESLNLYYIYEHLLTSKEGLLLEFLHKLVISSTFKSGEFWGNPSDTE